MNVNKKKSLSIFPEISEIEYASNIDSNALNTQLKSLEESVLRALLRGKDMTSEMTRIEAGVIKQYNAMSAYYKSLDYESEDKSYASAFNITNDFTSPGNLFYDQAYGYITLNPIAKYSKIPRGEKYNGRVSPDVKFYLNDVEYAYDSDVYDALDGTRKSFWMQDYVTEITTFEFKMELPPSLTKRFNYIEINPFPVMGFKINDIQYDDFYGSSHSILTNIYGMNPLENHKGEPLKIYLSPKEFNGTVTIFGTVNTLNVIGWSNIDIGFMDFENTTKVGHMKFDTFDSMSRPKDIKLKDIVVDYYFDGPKAQELITSNEPPIKARILIGKENDDGTINNTSGFVRELDISNITSFDLQDIVVTLNDEESVFLEFELKEHNMTTPVIRGAKLNYEKV